MKHAKEGRVKMDSVKDAQEHFGYDNSEWNELRKSKQKELREVSYKRHQRGSTYAKGGEIKVGDTVYTAVYTDSDGEKHSVGVVANSESEAKAKAKSNPLDAEAFTYITKEGKIKDGRHLSEYMSIIDNKVLKGGSTYAKGGEIGDKVKYNGYEYFIEGLLDDKTYILSNPKKYGHNKEYRTIDEIEFAKGGLTKGYHKMPDGEIMKNSEHLPLIGGIVGVLLGIFLNR